MRKIIIIAASLFTLTAAEAQTAAKTPDWWPGGTLWVDVTTEYEAWRACVAAKAERFSKGPDAANLIVEAAQLACKEARSRLVQRASEKKGQAMEQYKKDHQSDYVWGFESGHIADSIESYIGGEALLHVIELRAAK